jgi:predicted nucleotidyltransferase
MAAGQAQMSTTLDQSLIDEIVRRILSVAQPDRIILFGSHARGDARGGSDIDLLVVYPEVASPDEEMMRLRRELVPLGRSVDVLVVDASIFNKWSEAPGTTLYWAKREGEVLYDAAA